MAGSAAERDRDLIDSLRVELAVHDAMIAELNVRLACFGEQVKTLTGLLDVARRAGKTTGFTVLEG